MEGAHYSSLRYLKKLGWTQFRFSYAFILTFVERLQVSGTEYPGIDQRQDAFSLTQMAVVNGRSNEPTTLSLLKDWSCGIRLERFVQVQKPWILRR
uniref:Uncharacterized protein n=1 Tax=Utricularia reniformis TaxID=192314 RepID=A0A1Y0B474_9LAMI|nr:hypothetical protein AEK19_MT2101 [Utricularia reniformis]ART32255.1 hypothetical protein AEK19_MT2101 [Utricularia reniformis]